MSAIIPIYTKISDDINGVIEAIAEEEKKKKSDIIRDLLEKGLLYDDLQGQLDRNENTQVESQKEKNGLAMQVKSLNSELEVWKDRTIEAESQNEKLNEKINGVKDKLERIEELEMKGYEYTTKDGKKILVRDHASLEDLKNCDKCCEYLEREFGEDPRKILHGIICRKDKCQGFILGKLPHKFVPE